MKPHDVNPAPEDSPERPIQSHLATAENLLDTVLTQGIRFLAVNDRLALATSAHAHAALAQVHATLAHTEATCAAAEAIDTLADQITAALAALVQRQGDR